MTDRPYSRILVPTDFSDLATGAMRLAQTIAERAGGEIHVVYADPFLPPPHYTSSQVEALAEQIRQSKEIARKELGSHAAENLPDSLRVQSSVIEKLPIPAIVDYASNHDVDLIVMGTHGRSGINRLMLGSVTERVLRETPVPLLTTRSTPEDLRPIRKILCPVNFTGAAEEALRHARDLASLMDAELIVAHSTEKTTSETEEVAAIDRCVIGAGATADEVRRVVLRGSADEAVLRYIADEAIDLVVLAATHRRLFDTTVLGSTTVHVIRHSTVPVLTITSRS